MHPCRIIHFPTVSTEERRQKQCRGVRQDMHDNATVLAVTSALVLISKDLSIFKYK